MLRPFYPVFKANFGGNPGIRYAINRAFKEALVGEYPDFSIDLEKLVFAEGAIYTVAHLAATKTAADKLKIDWDTTVLVGTDPNALLNVVLYNEDTNQALTCSTDILHAAGTATIDIPAIWNGALIHSWLFFCTANKSRFSNSQYINSIQL